MAEQADIPDEAWAAIRNGSYCSEAGAVELAAPHIARECLNAAAELRKR